MVNHKNNIIVQKYTAIVYSQNSIKICNTFFTTFPNSPGFALIGTIEKKSPGFKGPMNLFKAQVLWIKNDHFSQIYCFPQLRGNIWNVGESQDSIASPLTEIIIHIFFNYSRKKAAVF